jgi:hypothetical protein
MRTCSRARRGTDLKHPRRRHAASLTLAAILVLFAATAASAQPDTYPPMTDGQAGALALRNACKSDIQRFCASELAPGGRILECLRAHGDAISPVCRETAGALRAGGASGLDIPPGAGGPPPPSGRDMPPPGRDMPPWAAMLAARDACMMDAQRFCSHVVPGGGRIIRCLMAQRDAVSRHCRDAMAAARDALGY